MQRLITIRLKNLKKHESEPSVEEHLKEDLQDGWRVVQAFPVAAVSSSSVPEWHKPYFWLTVVLEKTDS